METPKENKEECHSIDSVMLNKVEVQQNGIIRNEKGRLIGRLVNGVDYNGEHVKGLNSSAPQTPELKGNKFTWSPEKAKELQEICDRLNKTPDSMDWEEEFDGRFGRAGFRANNVDWEVCAPEIKEYIKSLLALAHSSGRREGIEEALNNISVIEIDSADESFEGGADWALKIVKNHLKSLLDKDLT